MARLLIFIFIFVAPGCVTLSGHTKEGDRIQAGIARNQENIAHFLKSKYPEAEPLVGAASFTRSKAEMHAKKDPGPPIPWHQGAGVVGGILSIMTGTGTVAAGVTALVAHMRGRRKARDVDGVLDLLENEPDPEKCKTIRKKISSSA